MIRGKVTFETAALRQDLAVLEASLEKDLREALQACLEEAERSARASTLYKDRTGNLRDKTRGQMTPDVGGNLQGILTANTPYAAYVDGGRHAVQGNPILRFVINGVTYFRRSVKEAAPRPFMRNAEAWGKIVLEDALNGYVGNSVQRFNA